MKVCLLNDSFPPVIDGVANVVLNYARIMQEEGLAEVMVGTPRYPGADYDSYPYKVVPYSSLDTGKISRGYRAGNPLDLLELHRMAKFKPDIIHTHCPVVSAIIARTLREPLNAPVIFTYHTKFDEDISAALKSEFARKEVIRGLVNNISACDEVWVVSNGAGENLKSLGYEGDYRVVANGVDFPKGRVSQEEVIKATSGYDLPEGVPVYLFVGRMVKYKGLPLVIDAMAKLKNNGYDFRMVFIGSGLDETEMKAKVTELGLEDKCIFTGAIHDRNVLRAWNTRADLFLFMSTYDTNGLVVREAAACGLASVLIKGSCAAEGITHARNGFITEGDADSLYELLAEHGSKLEYLYQVGENAMNEIYLSWTDSVRAAHERYGEILEEKAAGRSFAMHSKIADSIYTNTDAIITKTDERIQEGLRTIKEDIFEESLRTIKEDIFEEGVRTIKEELIEENVRQFREEFQLGHLHNISYELIEDMRTLYEKFKNL